MWNYLLNGIRENLLSDIVSNVVCVGVPILLALAVYHTRGRRRLRHFFGIRTRRAGTVQLLLSNIWVKPAGSLSPTTTGGGGFVGSAITAAEYEHAIKLVGEIQSQPFVGALHALAEQFGVRAIEPPVRAHIGPSVDWVRPTGNGFDFATIRAVDFTRDKSLVDEIRRLLAAERSFVLIGSTVYNVLTYYVLTHCGEQSRVEFVQSQTEAGHFASAIKVKKSLNGADHTYQRQSLMNDDGDTVYEEYFVVQKITNWSNSGATIFVCAGTSTAATAAAINKLANWRSLVSEFGNGHFCIVYRLLTIDREMPGTSETRPSTGAVSRVWPPER